MGVTFAPTEDDTPAIIHPNAVMTPKVALKGLEAVAGGCPQVVERRRCRERVQPSERDTSEL